MALRYPENELNYNYQGTISFTAFEEKLTDVTLADLENFLKVTQSTFFSNLGVRDQAGAQISRSGPGGLVSTGGGGGSAAQVESQASLAQKEAIDGMYATQWRPPARSDMKDRVKTKSETTTLYLPPNLVFGDGVTYDNNFELGVIGAGALEGLRSGKSIASSVLKGIEESFSSIAESLSGPLKGDIAKVGAVRTAAKLPGGFGEGLAQTATGVTVNPNRRTIMKGPNIRSFTFNFSLIPSSVSEAETIKKIIRFFRTELYPEEIRAGNIGVGYKVPRKFDIRIKYGDKEIASKILPCFLQNVQTVYNPSSMSFHKGGEFAEIQMSLNFVEERALNKFDITGGEFETKIEGFTTLDGRGLVSKYQGGY